MEAVTEETLDSFDFSSEQPSYDEAEGKNWLKFCVCWTSFENDLKNSIFF
jgi:hypothetical protein